MQTISELTEKEIEWVARQIQEAVRFVESFSPSDSGSPLTLAVLDRAFKNWMESEPKNVESINSVINAVGVMFGGFLTRVLDSDGSSPSTNTGVIWRFSVPQAMYLFIRRTS